MGGRAPSPVPPWLRHSSCYRIGLQLGDTRIMGARRHGQGGDLAPLEML